jgi:hypothetical protein
VAEIGSSGPVADGEQAAVITTNNRANKIRFILDLQSVSLSRRLAASISSFHLTADSLIR